MRTFPITKNITFNVLERFMEAIVFMKTPWPIVSDHMYSVVKQAWKFTIEAQDCQQALAGAPAVMSSV